VATQNKKLISDYEKKKKKKKDHMDYYPSNFSRDTMAGIVSQLIDFDPDLGIENVLVLLYRNRHVVEMLLAILLQRPLVVLGRWRGRGRGVGRGVALVSSVGVVGIAITEGGMNGVAVDDVVGLIAVG
jgi:hypothetical protein